MDWATRGGLGRWPAALFIGCCLLRVMAFGQDVPTREVQVLLVVGASGTEDYERLFQAQLNAWKEACATASVDLQVIGQDESKADLPLLETAVRKAASAKSGQLWLVMIGHGTFDGREAKFNLRGPDVSGRELGEWLKPLTRDLVVVHAASASAGFLQPLSGKGRVIVTATKSADEVFFTHFGGFFAPAIAGQAEADLDQDKQVSVLEAFLFASKKTAEFYEKEGRLATEHALLDDNGDGIGTRFEVFKGGKASDPSADGARAAQLALVLSEEERRLTDSQRQQRDALERQLELLKTKREALGEDRYYGELEKLLRQLTAVYGDS